jgi:cytochrome c
LREIRAASQEMFMRLFMICAVSFALLATSADAGDASSGKTVFSRCAICHTVQQGGANGLGPNLFGVVGRKAASLSTFAYSAALKNSRITWTPDKLKNWVTSPARMVPGTKMAFAGISNPKQADDVVAYLATLK